MARQRSIDGDIVLILILGVFFLTYLAFKGISIPDGLYPEVWFNKFASWVDGVFYGIDNPLYAKPKATVQAPVDRWLGAVYEWIVGNLPHPARPKDRSGDVTSDTPQVQTGDAGGFETSQSTDQPTADSSYDPYGEVI